MAFGLKPSLMMYVVSKNLKNVLFLICIYGDNRTFRLKSPFSVVSIYAESSFFRYQKNKI
jgi:hypothetical protein